MGVVSKALRFAVFGSIILSGCAVSPSVTEPDTAYPDLEGRPAGQEAAISQAASVSDAGEGLATGQNAQQPLLAASSETIFEADSGLKLRLEKGGEFSRVALVTQTEPTFDVLQIDNPARLVVDLLGSRFGLNEKLAVENDRFVSSIRIGDHADRTRFVFDLIEQAGTPAAHSIDSDSGTVFVTFSAEMEEPKLEASPEAQLGQEVSDQVPSAVVLREIEFDKRADEADQVTLGLTDSVAFQLEKSAPTEYVLTIPGVRVSAEAARPLVALKDSPGIRSVRVTESGDNAYVRMFVDQGIGLHAQPLGSSILIKAQQAAADPSARAQLKPEKTSEIITAGQGQTLPVGARAQVEQPEYNEDTARENPTGVRAADGSKLYTGRLISLDLQDTDIDNALRIIAEVSNLNIIASDDVTGKVTLRLIDVPWDQALDVILKTNGLGQVTEGNVIRIAPVQKLQQEAEALNRAKIAQRQLEDLSVNFVRISYARAEDVTEHVEGVLTERGTVTADSRTNQLIIRDTKQGLEDVQELIERLDLRTPQVLLETQIVEGARNILRDLGFQWNFSYIQSPETGNATGYNFPNSVDLAGGTTDGVNDWAVNFPAVLSGGGSAVSAVLDSADGSRALSARLSMLETEGKVKVVSRPQVATINNKEAVIKSVETVRVRLPSSGTSVGIGTGATAGGGASTAVEEIDVGIELTVTPQASPDYYVLLDVNARSSTFGSERVDNIPSTLEREATSTVLVKSGQTFALGGVYRLNDEDLIEGVPWFKDIPVLGVLFRRTFVNKSDEELIFFITPHIVEGSFDDELMEVKAESEEETLG